MFEELQGRLTLDSSDYQDSMDEAQESTEEMGETSEETSESLLELDMAGLAVGASMTGLGYATDRALDATRDMRETAFRTAVTLGRTQEEVTDLATELSNATFPVEEAVFTLESLAQQGVESEESLEELAETADRIADATSSQADAVANQLIPALRGLGHDTEELTDYQDYMVRAINTTTMEMGDFAQTIERAQQDLQDFDLEMDEVSGMLARFQDETGLSGRYLRREFGQAVREADGDIGALYEELGISKDEVKGWTDDVEEAGGEADRYSDSVEENVTWMDELKSSFNDFKLELFDTLGPLRNLLPLLQALGPLMMAVSTINFSAVIPSIKGVTASIWGMTKALLANPIGIILVAITSLIAVLFVLEKRFNIITRAIDWLGDAVSNAWERITDFFSWIKDVAIQYLKYWLFWWYYLFDFFRDIVPEVIDRLKGIFGDLISYLTDIFSEGLDKIVDFFKGLPSRIYDAIKGIFDDALSWGYDLAENLIDGVVDGIKDLGGRMKDSLTSAIGFDVRSNDQMAEEWGEDLAQYQTKGYEQKMEKDTEPSLPSGRSKGSSRTKVEVVFENPIFIDSSRDRKRMVELFEEELTGIIKKHV